MFSLTKVEKPLVLLSFRPKMLKNHWFYKPGHQKCSKSIGFTVACLKNNSKTNPWPPGNRRATDSGAGITILVRRCYEEPIQASCLGNNPQPSDGGQPGKITTHRPPCPGMPVAPPSGVGTCHNSKPPLLLLIILLLLLKYDEWQTADTSTPCPGVLEGLSREPSQPSYGGQPGKS